MTAAVLARPTRRRRRTVRPDRWLLAAAGAAWLALLLGAFGGAGHADHASHASSSGWRGWIAVWLLMVIAMMWPLWTTFASALAGATATGWRALSIGTFLAAITALWLVAGIVARVGYLSVEWIGPAWLWPAAWLSVAAGVGYLSLWRRRVLQACSRGRTVAHRGRRCLTTSGRVALRMWPSCALLCGPVMLAMVGAHAAAPMVGGSVAVWWEQRHPRAWRDRVPAGVLALTVVIVVVQGGSG